MNVREKFRKEVCTKLCSKGEICRQNKEDVAACASIAMYHAVRRIEETVVEMSRKL